MTRQRGELAICVVLAVLGLAMAVRSFSYHVLGAGGRIGPGFMPLVAGVALAGFAAWAFTEAFVRQRRERAAQPEPGGDGDHDGDARDDDRGPEDTGAGNERRVTLVFAMTLAALVLSIVTGFLVAFGLLVLALLWFVEREKPWLAVTISVVATAGSWLVFVVLFQVPLPGGMLGLLGGA